MTKTFKRLLLTMMSVIMVFALAVSVLGIRGLNSYALDGAGTAEDPYLIGTAAQLEEAVRMINADEDGAASAYYVLTEDIDWGNESWIPMGIGETQPFKGHFDGAFHAVKNIQLDAAYKANGLFGYTSGATIERLGVENVTAAYVAVGGTDVFVGGLVGYASASTINRCYSDNPNLSVQLIGVDSFGGVGGLVGEIIFGTDVNGDLQRSVVANSYATRVAVTSYGQHAGGLVGHEQLSTVIENSYAQGNVYADGASIGTVEYGTLVGHIAFELDGRAAVIRNSFYGLNYPGDTDSKPYGASFSGNVANVDVRAYLGNGADCKLVETGAYLTDALANYTSTQNAELYVNHAGYTYLDSEDNPVVKYNDNFSGIWFHNVETPDLVPTAYAINYDLANGAWAEEYVAPSTYTYGNYAVANGGYAESTVALPTAANVARAGYEFTGWTATYADGSTEDNVTVVAEFIAGTVTLTANWNAVEVNYVVEIYVSVNENSETDTYPETPDNTYTLTAITDTTATVDPATYLADAGVGHVFDEYNTNNVLSYNVNGDGSTVLKVYYMRAVYGLTFNAPNSDWYADSETVSHKYYVVSLLDEVSSEPTKTGYTFEGWALTNGATVADVLTEILIEGDTNVYAVWTANTIEATFIDYQDATTNYNVINYGTITQTYDAPYVFTYVNDEDVTVDIANPTKLGYTFVGWFKEGADVSDPANAITSATVMQETADVTLYAHWTALEIRYEVVVNVYNRDDSAEGGESATSYVISDDTFTIYTDTTFNYTVVLDESSDPAVINFTDENGKACSYNLPEGHTVEEGTVSYKAEAEREENGTIYAKQIVIEVLRKDYTVTVYMGADTLIYTVTFEDDVVDFFAMADLNGSTLTVAPGHTVEVVDENGNTVTQGNNNVVDANGNVITMPAQDIYFTATQVAKMYEIRIRFSFNDERIARVILTDAVVDQYPVTVTIGNYSYDDSYHFTTADKDTNTVYAHVLDVNAFNGTVAGVVGNDVTYENDRVDFDAVNSVITLKAVYYTVVVNEQLEDTNGDGIAEEWITYMGGVRKLVTVRIVVDGELYAVPTHLLSNSIYDDTVTAENPYGIWNKDEFNAYLAGLEASIEGMEREEAIAALTNAGLVHIESVVGPQGPQGPQGEQGPQGATGANGQDATASTLTKVLPIVGAAMGGIGLIMAIVALAVIAKKH